VPYHNMKYDKNSNMKNWLEDYRLSIKSVGASDPYFMVQYLLIFLADSDTLKRALSKNANLTL
jgi:hypothetical protein